MGYHPIGARGVWNDERVRRNYELAGGRWQLCTVDDATNMLAADGERSKPKRYWAPNWSYLRPKCIPIWFAFLDVTWPLQKLLGLRQPALSADLGRYRHVRHPYIQMRGYEGTYLYSLCRLESVRQCGPEDIAFRASRKKRPERYT